MRRNRQKVFRDETGAADQRPAPDPSLEDVPGRLMPVDEAAPRVRIVAAPFVIVVKS